MKEELGCHEVDDLAERSHDQVRGILDRIEAIKPTSLSGMQAKAAVLLNWYWEDQEADEDDRGSAIALELIKGLVSAPLAA